MASAFGFCHGIIQLSTYCIHLDTMTTILQDSLGTDIYKDADDVPKQHFTESEITNSSTVGYKRKKNTSHLGSVKTGN